MPKAPIDVDVLVLGSHPCADLAAATLRQNSTLRVMQALVPNEPIDDRLVYFNTDFFALHPLLAPLKQSLESSPVYGLRFLCDDAAVRSEFAGKTIAGHIAPFKTVRAAMQKISQEAGVTRVRNASLEIKKLDEKGVEVTLDGKSIKAKALIVAAELPTDARRVLGLPLAWERDVVHRYAYIKCKANPNVAIAGEDPTQPLMPMSLDLKGKLTWAWAMQSAGVVQFAIEHPIESGSADDSIELLGHWLSVLASHGVIKDADAINLASAKSLELPFAGALAQEDVGNRTLLIGPAGGFYSACGEDIYPACWSAIFAADAIKKALKEKHLQDALHPYRQKWGATLGDYLRGPQQNLRFLLSLVYRNKVMTARLAEAILFGKSVVR